MALAVLEAFATSYVPGVLQDLQSRVQLLRQPLAQQGHRGAWKDLEHDPPEIFEVGDHGKEGGQHSIHTGHITGALDEHAASVKVGGDGILLALGQGDVA